LKSEARIQGKLCYGVLDVPEGAEINGDLVRMDNKPQAPQAQGKGEEPTGDKKDPAWKSISNKNADKGVGLNT